MISIGMGAGTDYVRLVEVLRTWSALYARPQRKSSSWDCSEPLRQRVRELDQYARQHLEAARDRSAEELHPLGEPLGLSLGQHRWLSLDREESYSDWLAWILQGIAQAAQILPLLGLDTAGADALGQAETVRREEWSEQGRTDIEIRFGKRAFLLVEVKVQPPGDYLPDQLKRYEEKARREGAGRTMLVLLAPEKPEEKDCGKFEFVAWRNLCPRLRRHASQVIRTGTKPALLQAAAILIFCGAVEQNLLGLSMQPQPLRAMPTLDYLRKWRDEA
jgi:hypothetical protein